MNWDKVNKHGEEDVKLILIVSSERVMEEKLVRVASEGLGEVGVVVWILLEEMIY